MFVKKYAYSLLLFLFVISFFSLSASDTRTLFPIDMLKSTVNITFDKHNDLVVYAFSEKLTQKERDRYFEKLKREDISKVVTAQNSNESTLLHCCAIRGDQKGAEWLINNNAVIDKKNSKGETPLHEAARFGHDNIIKLLINNRADVNAKAQDDSTPLHYAVKSYRRICVKVLLQNGAKNLIDESQNTPFMIAVHSEPFPFKDNEKNKEEIISLLQPQNPIGIIIHIGKTRYTIV